MTVALELYDRTRAAIAARGFDAQVQTRIALFVGAARSINAAIMGTFELQPQVTTAYPFIHGQYSREVEFVTLLARVTRWLPDPAVYLEGARIVTPLWTEWYRLLVPGSPADPAISYGALALGHALLARVRIAPALPEDANLLDPFVVAIRRIEQESGRMIQAQIRLLKDGATPLGTHERERIIEAKQAAVDAAFRAFLEWLSDLRTTTAPPSDDAAPATWAFADPLAALRATFEAAWTGMSASSATIGEGRP